MNARGFPSPWRRPEEEPDHRTEVVLRKLEAAVQRFEVAKRRVDRAVEQQANGDRRER